ncbi:uncharacterized protein vgf [Polymixia lowei]
MIRTRDASSVLTLLVLVSGASFLPLSAPGPIDAPRLVGSPGAASPGLAVTGDGASRGEESNIAQEGREGAEERAEERKEEDELFKDVDPKTLAAVLLEALNKPKMERRKEGEEREGIEEEEKGERAEATEKEQNGEEARATEGANRDREQELELLMAATALQGEREREEEEKKKVKEEEEKLTERVKSRTSSHAVPVKTEQPAALDVGGEEITRKEAGANEAGQGAGSQRGPNPPGGSQQRGEQRSDEEEEQLSPEELKNLETMMKEFQSFSTANKRERDSRERQRESRGYSPYNDIPSKNKGYDLSMSKKKLKWQEETQKAFPVFRGGNFMDEFENSFDNAGSDLPQPRPPSDNDVMEEDEPEEGEEDEEALSPEEEEARAKAEQEEVRRQAAEAQRAKLEEEKLADIASDMLLQYMVKQNNGNRKHRNQNRKYSSSLSNTAEDKRSDEDQEVKEEDDDIDPQTIDKLIEISSKLHLPADDVVDIISDVEKKKKKDVPPEMASLSPWQRPLMPLSSPSSSYTKGISASQIPTNQNSLPLAKQAQPAVNPLKAWFQEKPPTKSSLANQDVWFRPAKPLSTNQDLLLQLQKPRSNNQDLWLKAHKPFRTSYPPYSSYPSFYQRKPYRGYYPILFSAPPKHKPHYYIPKPALTLNNLLGNSPDYDYNAPPKRHFRNWVQPRLRKPPASLQNPYYANYFLTSYPRTFQQLPIPKPGSPPRLAGIPPYRNRFYYSPPAPIVARDDVYSSARIGNQPDNSSDNELENYIQQILMKQPRMFK